MQDPRLAIADELLVVWQLHPSDAGPIVDEADAERDIVGNESPECVV
jgi:hypothetical protein